MKKLIIVYVVLIIAVALLAFMRNGTDFSKFLSFGNNATAQIGDSKINLIIADSDDERVKGLSGRNNLAKNQGMLFVFDKKDTYGFWMKNMKFPLDIIYIDDSTVVDLVVNAKPASDSSLVIFKPEKPVNYVLELNAGDAKKYNIKKGTKITFTDIK